MLSGAMFVWFVLAELSVLFVIWDSLTNTPVSWVQKLAWILVVAYTGPVGLFFYLLACRNPAPGMHDAFTRPLWKQGLNSEMHCLAGDATGIVIAAAVVPAFALANGIDLVIEYSAGFVVGLFIFQALMMRQMYDGNYLQAVRKTFFAEAVSMNMVMLGMIPTMVVLAHWMPGSMDPTRPDFWFRMSMAALVGGVTAFPVNRWLVANGLKHGCMTLPDADGPKPAMGHASMEGMQHPHGGHGGTETKESPAMGHASMEGMQHDGDSGDMAMNELSTARAAAWVIGSFGLMLLACWLVSLYVPISFTK